MLLDSAANGLTQDSCQVAAGYLVAEQRRESLEIFLQVAVDGDAEGPAIPIDGVHLGMYVAAR